MAVQDRLRARARRVLAGAGLALTALTGAACGDSATGLDENDVEGSYDAVSLTVTQDGVTEDVIDNGGYMFIDLLPDGSTQGEIFVPNGGDFGEDVYLDLEGEWEVRSGRVYIDTFEDTFLRDAPLEIQSRNRLTMDETFSSARVQLDLRRTDDF